MRTNPQAPPGQTSGTRLILRLIRASICNYWGTALLILIGLLIEMSFKGAIPIAFKFLVDYAIVPRNGNVLVEVLVGLFCGLVVASAARIGLDYLNAAFTTGVLNGLRWRMFTHLQLLSMDFFARAKAVDILGRFSNDLTTLDRTLGSATDGLVLSTMNLGLSLFLMLRLDWRLGIIALLGVPAGFAGPGLFTPRAAASGDVRKHNESKLSHAVQESFAGQSVVKVFGLEKTMRARFAELTEQVASACVRVSFFNSLIEQSSAIGTLAVQILLLAVGGYMGFHGDLTIGSLAAFQTLFINSGSALAKITHFYPSLLQAGLSMQRIDEFLAEKPGVVDLPDARTLPRLSREIRFDGVNFGYTPAQQNLNNVSFTIRAGESVAFVGPSGSGKSTVISVLTRFYEPGAGAVTFDGDNVREVSQESLRAQLGVVFQESVLFNTTIRENIRVGKTGATDAETEAAARAAEMHEIVMAMPRGYDTPVGERGSHLSGGERQRIAIARAILRDPRVLVLDEAASALDAATEMSINKTVERLAQGRTVVSVTHRLASIAKSDRIFVMDRGQLVEQGRHDELLGLGGVYSKLWEKQHGFVIAADGGAQVEPSRLQAIPMLQSLDYETLKTLADIFTTERSRADRDVFREGDPGDKFYIVARGTLTVWVNRAGGEQEKIRTMQDGDHFGEIALMEDTTRTATVRTSTDCIFLTLGRDPFLKLLEREPKLREAFQKVVAERLQASGTILRPRPS